MILIDAVSRFIPGVLGDEQSAHDESFSDGLLEYPQYTRPAEISRHKVPDILMNGDHKNIAKWRRERSVVNTFYSRPDLLAKADLGDADRATLEGIFTGGNR
jgi:tRNA (guanine37-N1)-methyltransferase